MDKNKSQKQTGQGKQDQANAQRKNEPTANARGAEQGRQQQPGSNQNQQTGQQAHRSSADSAQSGSSQTGKSDQTITNQDEQRQVTNSGGSKPLGEEETEGDRQREERLKPYKNAGDDSGETEKKSPTMK
jgi:hypothetical protein